MCPICDHPLVEKHSKGKVTVVCSNEKAHPHAAPIEAESSRKSS
jgi:DNA topoisomerase-1